MSRKGIIAGCAVAAAILLVYYLYGGGAAPKGQGPLVRLNSSNLDALKDAFNGSANSARLLVLVSPTCPVCLKGSSAVETLLHEQKDPAIRAFVVWEPVLPTDLAAPSTSTLRRVSDPRVTQYWDKDRLVSRLLGERDRSSVVWDYVAVYQPGRLWDQAPPKPVSSGAPVVRAIGGARDAVLEILQKNPK